mmetsp:Transcript_14854/g.44050  ORF Transcript_14854/g.44050 Transcript_14854/m.44050 type:complete len:212 (+) Transcript_14854:1995-2630(+)
MQVSRRRGRRPRGDGRALPRRHCGLGADRVKHGERNTDSRCATSVVHNGRLGMHHSRDGRPDPRQVGVREEAVLLNMHLGRADQIDVAIKTTSFVPPSTAVIPTATVAVVGVHEDGNHGGLARLHCRDVVEPKPERGVSTHVGRRHYTVHPHRRLPERALEIKPECRPLPIGRDGELLPVPQHVARDVAPTGTPVGASLGRKVESDKPVMR